jgi:3-phytase
MCDLKWLAIVPVAGLIVAASDLAVFDVPACTQTYSVHSPGDAADDVAIWVNAAAPEETLVLGTDKRAGLNVFDLTGRELQFIPLGKLNNVDVRSDFPFWAGKSPIVAVSNRSTHSVTLLRLDEKSKRLVSQPVGSISLPSAAKIEGVCLYRSRNGAFHVGATDEGGNFYQWHLKPGKDATIMADLVRKASFGSELEACVYDDELGWVYVGEEMIALWKMRADPHAGDDRLPVDLATSANGFLPDLEGIAVYEHDDGTGYIVASIQGDSSFRVYRREGDNDFLGAFRVIGCPDGSVDDVTQTDGIAITSAPLGSKWPAGLLIVQDDQKTAPPNNQNFKFVSWEEVQKRLKLAPSIVRP